MRSTGQTTSPSLWCCQSVRLFRMWCQRLSNPVGITSSSRWTPQEVGTQVPITTSAKKINITVISWSAAIGQCVMLRVLVWTPHRESPAEAGCHCSLHSAGNQRETLHLHKQPSGTAGKESCDSYDFQSAALQLIAGRRRWNTPSGVAVLSCPCHCFFFIPVTLHTPTWALRSADQMLNATCARQT